MTNIWAVRMSALLGGTAVALGAFGAHGFKEILTNHGTTAIWQTAVFYHLIHAVMLFLLAERTPVPMVPWISFSIGIVIFSGSLYVLALTGQRWLGAITPFGGVSFLVGWCCLALSKHKSL
jgi:uncharacterized membrane protein YgdD (TMEM256/DUF423 family)